jgi:acetyltransferase-like isoleucine patch superfamily enzyme
MIAKLARGISRIGSAWRIFLIRQSGVRLGAKCLIEARSEIALHPIGPRAGAIALGNECQLSVGVILHPYGGNISLGRSVFVGPYAVIYGHGGVEIGDDTLISMHCRILSSNHTIASVERRTRWEPDVLRPTKIGRDVWLGAGVTVLGGVTIGEGCIVGAGAVVTHDLPPYSIAMGVPAAVKGQRPVNPTVSS